MNDSTHSILHFVNKDDPRGPYPTNPASDGQYYLWEYGVTIWKTNQFGQLFNDNEVREDNSDEEEDEGEDVGDRQ